ncbi:MULTISPECIES: hypothetical protein [Actinomadura]|uniref:BPL/LPL catalytic domain-containing protein n=1 Tax=Actinomadura litoris TaxID=2678616 RepID=A0A7K1L8G0_9ACTN|nr:MULTISPECIES: hypothetical protein [Actinomadura]MBT2213048.1 hypothetical protein [Actinomadura sp. NEAU-AAG7]MUN40718.1 hypothetical protein [Actinomadura litoris]
MLSVILDDTRDPARNLALDEALARAAAYRSAVGHGPRTLVRRSPSGRPVAGRFASARPRPAHSALGGAVAGLPVLRVWQCSPSVMVGRFQDVARAADLAACARDGVEVVRRATGGGAVCFGPGTLAFTLVQRPGRRVPLEELVFAAVEGLGVPRGPLRAGRAVQAARLLTRTACLVHVAVQVGPGGACPAGDAAGDAAGRPTLADFGPAMTMDAVRAAVLGAVVDAFGAARTRRPDALESSVRDHLHAVRYGDLAWHLTGAPGDGASMSGSRAAGEGEHSASAARTDG